MRILHVISGDLWAGAEVQAYALLRALHLHPEMDVAAALLNDGQLAAKLREAGIPVFVFPESRLNALKILRGLRNLARDWCPDIVHTHRTKENILGSIANAVSRRVPCIRTVHGAPESAPPSVGQLHKWTLVKLDRWCGQYLQARAVAVSEPLAAAIGQVMGPDRVVHISNGIDIEATRAVARPLAFTGAQNESVHIGIVGRMVPVKRVDLFLEMAVLLRQREMQRNWRFHVFGDGPLLTVHRQAAEARGLNDAITFHGHRQDIVSCIASMNALVICSDHEGLPMTLLEALALGTPVVAHDVGGITGVLQRTGGGVLVPSHAPHAYADAILATLAKPSDAHEHSKTLAQLEAHYSSKQNAKQVLAVYEDCVTQQLATSARLA